jgi:hypothetical protein
LAGWLRLALSTLSDWRSQHQDRGPAWVLVAGMPRYRMGHVRSWLLEDRPRQNSQSLPPTSRSRSGSRTGSARALTEANNQ